MCQDKYVSEPPLNFAMTMPPNPSGGEEREL